MLLLGEAPGEDEDMTGLPFQGTAGRVLNSLLLEAGIERASVWITNTALCRPTVGDPARNRAPFQPEVTACAPHLDAQLAVVRPSVIVTLGVIPAHRMLGDGVQLESDHGRPVATGEAVVIPTFHPASLRWRAGRRAARSRTCAWRPKWRRQPDPRAGEGGSRRIPARIDCLDGGTL